MHNQLLEHTLQVRVQVLASGRLCVLQECLQVVVLLHVGASEVTPVSSMGFVMLLVISRCHF